ncbi:MAG: gephyrin-like molybdotransferase Glp [bacterium]
MIPVSEAQRIILESIPALPEEIIDIASSLNRVLSYDIFSDIDIPSCNLSAMDGYALISSDVKGASEDNPIRLEVLEEIPAGAISKKEIKNGFASKIMTGAMLPEGADSVIMVEYTEAMGQSIMIKKETKPYENVIQRGENIKNGELLLEKGRIIGSSEIGILASLGIKNVKAIKQPKIAVLATGNEIVDIDSELLKGKTRNINTYTLSAQIQEAGAIPIDLGIGRDDKKDISLKIERGLKSADMLITSGGVSVGDYDITRNVLEDMGLIVKFHKVAMRPGKPTLFGIIREKPFFGLPGYPVSCIVCFEILVRPAILKMGGRKNLERQIIKAILGEDIRKKTDRRSYLRVSLKKKDGIFEARLTGNQGSSVLNSMVKADGLLIAEKDVGFIPCGSRVSVYLLRNV